MGGWLRVILVIDNYDSFCYNLVQLAGSINRDIRVVRNDEISLIEVSHLNPSHIIISPGPGYPKDAGICEEIVLKLSGLCPILGVCLGHQGICEACGAKIGHAKKLMHGKKSDIKSDNKVAIFKGLPERIQAARYHSLAVLKHTIPKQLQIIGEDDEGEVMAVKHKYYHVYGLQFHPESILTPLGEVILKNFLSI